MEGEAYTVSPASRTSRALVARRRRRLQDTLPARAFVTGRGLHARGTPLSPAAEGGHALGVQGVGDRLQGHPLGPHIRDPLLERGPVAHRRPPRTAHVACRLESLSGALLH